ncbi:MAG TPA: hypothetical protein V6C72_04035, partial [Chroococcales cyanobacterium]
LPIKYVGNNFSLKFHRPSCPFAQAMNAMHVNLYHFRRQAVSAGMVPCRYCLPPWWTTVRAQILGTPSRTDSNNQPQQPGAQQPDEQLQKSIEESRLAPYTIPPRDSDNVVRSDRRH